jgi:hypothetical protein
LAKRAADQIATRDWQRLIREQTITTANGTATYSLPTDWARYVDQTLWDATNYWQMRGSLSGQEWQYLKRSGATGATTRKQVRLFGNLVNIFPTPTAIQSLIIEYVRNTPWTASDGTTFKATPTADTDLFAMPQRLLELELKWRFKHAKGVDYSEDAQEAEDQIGLAFAQDTPATAVNYGVAMNDEPPYPNIPRQVT